MLRNKCNKSLTVRKEHAAKFTRYQNNPQLKPSLCAVNNNSYDFECYYVGALSHTCKYCYTLHFSCEKNTLGHFSLCCSAGKIYLLSSEISGKE